MSRLSVSVITFFKHSLAALKVQLNNSIDVGEAVSLRLTLLLRIVGFALRHFIYCIKFHYLIKFYSIIPPETSMRWALIHLASSVHKKATTPPISSGIPVRPKAVTDAT
jgi:hypothetical protein